MKPGAVAELVKLIPVNVLDVPVKFTAPVYEPLNKPPATVPFTKRHASKLAKEEPSPMNPGAVAELVKLIPVNVLDVPVKFTAPVYEPLNKPPATVPFTKRVASKLAKEEPLPMKPGAVAELVKLIPVNVLDVPVKLTAPVYDPLDKPPATVPFTKRVASKLAKEEPLPMKPD